MAEILVIVPTRSRPDNARRLMQSLVDTEATNARLLFCVDDDDPYLAEYESLHANLYIGPRLRIGPTINNAVELFADVYPIVGFMGDDHLPRTKHWDQAVIDALEELRTGIVYGNDLLQGEALPTAVFMTTNIPKTLGYLCPPGLLHMYLDNSWKEWGTGANCIKYLPDVIIEHMHPGRGKAEFDQGYAESDALMGSDHEVYMRYAMSDLRVDIEKIEDLINNA